jgi:hypothetical protein
MRPLYPTTIAMPMAHQGRKLALNDSKTFKYDCDGEYLTAL